jgi:hypothetical protein
LAGASFGRPRKFGAKNAIPVTRGNLDNVRAGRYCDLMLDRKRLEPLVAQISEVLQTKPMRNAEVLQAANINDYRAGEDAIYELVQQGRVRIEADSTLTWIASNEKKGPRGVGAAARGTSSRPDRAQKRP